MVPVVAVRASRAIHHRRLRVGATCSGNLFKRKGRQSVAHATTHGATSGGAESEASAELFTLAIAPYAAPAEEKVFSNQI